jgi:hypothetical protein
MTPSSSIHAAKYKYHLQLQSSAGQEQESAPSSLRRRTNTTEVFGTRYISSLAELKEQFADCLQDINLVLKRIPSGGWKVIYRIDQRWVKNNRDPENTVYGASTSQHGKLLYDDTQYLLALALADHAIFGIDSFDDLWQLQIPPGEDHLILRWNDPVQSVPYSETQPCIGVSPKSRFQREPSIAFSNPC